MSDDLTYYNRDVEENPVLSKMVFEYLMGYEKSFDFLIAMREKFLEENDLSITNIRKVLNCMRHDYDICYKMPAPLGRPWCDADESTGRSRRPRQKPKQCEKTEPHVGPHNWGKSYEFVCTGIDWPINRRAPYWKDVNVRASHCVSKSGRLIHLVAAEGHKALWTPAYHAWGWSHEIWQMQYYRAHQVPLSINLVCKFPSRLRNPILLTEEKVQRYMDNQEDLGVRELEYCPHCIQVASGSGS